MSQITVVGGGLAGLTAAIACAEGGAQGAAAGGARAARRAGAQRRGPVQSQPRPARPLQRRRDVGVAGRARPAAGPRPPAARRRALSFPGRRASHAAAGRDPRGAAPARPPGAGRYATSAAGSPRTPTSASPRCSPRWPASTPTTTTPASSPRRSCGSAPCACSSPRPPPSTVVRYASGGWSGMVAPLERRAARAGRRGADGPAAWRPCPRRR